MSGVWHPPMSHHISWPGGYGPWDKIIPIIYRPGTRYFTKLGMKLPDIRRTKDSEFLEKSTKSDDSNLWRDAITPFPEGSYVIASCRHTSYPKSTNLQFTIGRKLIKNRCSTWRIPEMENVKRPCGQLGESPVAGRKPFLYPSDRRACARRTVKVPPHSRIYLSQRGPDMFAPLLGPICNWYS